MVQANPGKTSLPAQSNLLVDTAENGKMAAWSREVARDTALTNRANLSQCFTSVFVRCVFAGLVAPLTSLVSPSYNCKL